MRQRWKWIVLFSVVLALVLLAVAGLRRALGWREMPSSTNGWRRWEKTVLVHGSAGWRTATITHIDRNGDGVVDWEINDQGMVDNQREREDTDYNGYFDRRFIRGFSGAPMNVVSIHEKVPSH